MWPFRKRRSPFESPFEELFPRRRAFRLARNAVLVLALLWAAVEYFGEPLLRWEYRYRGSRSHPTVVDATYVGLGGMREVKADALGRGCPVVLLVPAEPPLWKRASDRVGSMWDRLASRTN